MTRKTVYQSLDKNLTKQKGSKDVNLVDNFVRYLVIS